MNEWGFASEITKWWEAEFPHHPEWLLHAARVEEVVPGSHQRSDILVSGAPYSAASFGCLTTRNRPHIILRTSRTQ